MILNVYSFRNGSFRNFYEFFGFGATDRADEVGGEFFTGDGEDTVVAGIFFHNSCSFTVDSCCTDR